MCSAGDDPTTYDLERDPPRGLSAERDPMTRNLADELGSPIGPRADLISGRATFDDPGVAPSGPVQDARRDWIPAPEPRDWFGWMIPALYVPLQLATCRGCGLLISWCLTPRGRRSPHNRDGASHFATCPRADLFRRAATPPIAR